MILFQGVHKEYPRTGSALNEVSFHIRKGEFTFVTGPSPQISQTSAGASDMRWNSSKVWPLGQRYS